MICAISFLRLTALHWLTEGVLFGRQEEEEEKMCGIRTSFLGIRDLAAFCNQSLLYKCSGADGEERLSVLTGGLSLVCTHWQIAYKMALLSKLALLKSQVLDLCFFCLNGQCSIKGLMLGKSPPKWLQMFFPWKYLLLLSKRWMNIMMLRYIVNPAWRCTTHSTASLMIMVLSPDFTQIH